MSFVADRELKFVDRYPFYQVAARRYGRVAFGVSDPRPQSINQDFAPQSGLAPTNRWTELPGRIAGPSGGPERSNLWR